MMDGQTTFGTVVNWYRSRTRSSRIAMTVGLIGMALALVQFRNGEADMPMCSLFGDTVLRPVELQRIQFALAQVGLGECEIRGDQLAVPAALRAEYLKAITEQGAVPTIFQDDSAAKLDINPFLSRSQQKLVDRNEKKRSVREMLARLPFVEQAWFEMDVAESRSAFEPNRQTAVCSIMPSNNTELSLEEVDTIRQIIGGALAGIDPRQIVVTDLGVGRAVSNRTGDNSRPTPLYQMARHSAPTELRQAFFENKINRALSGYEGIDFQVHYSSELKPTSSAGSPDRFAAVTHLIPNFSKPETVESGAERGEDTVGVNGTASVEDMGRAATDRNPDKQQEPILVRSQADMAKSMRSTKIEYVTVSVTVPQETVIANFGTAKVDTFLGFPLEQTPDNYLESNFEKLKSEIIEKIRPVLPVSSFDRSASYPISVTLNRQPGGAEAVGWPQFQNLLRQHWPTGAVLFIGFVILLVVVKSHSGGPLANSDPLISVDALINASDCAGEPAKSEEENQLSRLIEQDPEGAAKVIKSWIRNAA